MAQTTDWHTIQKIRGVVMGHPPGNPAEDVQKIREVVNPPKQRKAKGGYDREEKGGTDRSER